MFETNCAKEREREMYRETETESVNREKENRCWRDKNKNLANTCHADINSLLQVFFVPLRHFRQNTHRTSPWHRSATSCGWAIRPRLQMCLCHRRPSQTSRQAMWCGSITPTLQCPPVPLALHRLQHRQRCLHLLLLLLLLLLRRQRQGQHHQQQR